MKAKEMAHNERGRDIVQVGDCKGCRLIIRDRCAIGLAAGERRGWQSHGGAVNVVRCEVGQGTP